MKKIFSMIFLTMFLFYMPARVNAAANWIWVYSDDYETLLIDNNSIGRDNNGFFAYFKTTYSTAGKNRVIESRSKIGLHVNGYYNLFEHISFDYFKISNGIKYNSCMSYIEYDKNGNILDSYSWNYFNWHRIIPDSIGETMYDAAYARLWRK